MHIEIYALKMQMLSERFQLDQNELSQIKTILDYIVLFHMAFLRSRLGKNILKLLLVSFFYLQ
jgi:hypothetical protein